MKLRIVSLDSFKAICAFMVIFLHYGVRNAEIVNMYFRIAVPFFFAVAGYFLYADSKNVIVQRCRKHIKKLTGLNLIVCMALIIKSVGTSLIKGYDINVWYLSDWRFLLFNFSFASYLWFVRALIYVYIVVLFAMHSQRDKTAIENMLEKIAVAAVLLSLTLCKYSAALGLNISPDVYEIPCKFVGNAFGSFFIGYGIARRRKCIDNVSSKSLLFFLSISICLGGLNIVA